MKSKCKTCMNSYPSLECVNCGTKFWHYKPYRDIIARFIGAEIITNADRIREMSDEELAEFIPNWSYTKACKCDEEILVDCNNECEKCVLEWLQQPAEEAQ